MNTTPALDPTPYGPEIAALSTLAGVDPDTAALQAAIILAGLAGPSAGLLTHGGEWQPARLHLVLTGEGLARHERLSELLVRPALFIQETLRSRSHAARPALVREMRDRHGFPNHVHPGRRDDPDDYQRRDAELQERIASWTSMGQLAQFSQSCIGVRDPWLEQRSGRRVAPFELSRMAETELTHVDERHLRQPSLVVSGLAPDRVAKVIEEADQHHMLAWDREGRLFATLLEERDSKPFRLLREVLAGADLPTGHQIGFGSLERATISLYSILPWEILTGLGGGTGDQGYQRGQGFVLPLSTLVAGHLTGPNRDAIDPEDETGAAEVAIQYERYRDAVLRVVAERRAGGWFAGLALTATESGRFFAGQAEFIAQLDSIEPELRRHTRGLAHLPATLLFGLRALAPDGEIPDLVEPSLQLAHRAMAAHLDLLGGALLSGQRAEAEHRKQTMLRKLAAAQPCTARDLVRRFPVQRMALHGPVIDALVEEGRVERTQDGLLRLSDPNPTPLP